MGSDRNFRRLHAPRRNGVMSVGCLRGRTVSERLLTVRDIECPVEELYFTHDTVRPWFGRERDDATGAHFTALHETYATTITTSYCYYY